MNTEDRDTYDREVTGLRQGGLLFEIRTNAQANQMAKKTRQPKQTIPRFKVVLPGSIVELPSRPLLVPGKIVVFNIPVETSGNEIKDLFQQFGDVLQVQMPAPRPDFEHKYAFVTFADQKPVEALVSENTRLYLGGRLLRIDRYREKSLAQSN